MRRLLLSCAMASVAALAQAAELPRADPVSVGLDPGRLAAITQALKSDVEQHVLPGAVLLIARHGKIAYEEVVGSRDPQATTSAPAARDDIYAAVVQ